MKSDTLRFAIPVDGSPNALRAVEWAVRLFQCGTRIECVLVNVQPVLELRAHAYQSVEEIKKKEFAQAEEVLRPAREILSAAGVSHQSEYVVGPTAPAIMRLAEKVECDGILMGMRGMGFVLGPLTMGSVTSKVVHEAIMPVTVVK